ncbi:MAG: hypothetical protein ACLVKO_02480 [Dysgonomonas sp.]
MKRIILSGILLLSLTFCLTAQNNRHNKKHKADTERITKELNLTDEQKTRFDATNKNFKDAMKTLRDDKTLSKEEKDAKKSELRSEHRTNIQEILTSDQLQKWQSLRNDRTKMRASKEPNRGKAKNRISPRVNREMAKLNLTDEQKSKIRKINSEYRLKTSTLRSQQRNEVEAVLTPQQIEKRKEIKETAIANRHNINKEGAEKLIVLQDNYKKEKEAIRLSRISSDMQKTKLQQLREKYRGDREQIITESKL